MNIESAHPTKSVATAEQLAALPRGDARYELVKGDPRMMSPAGGRRGRIAMNLAVSLANHVASGSLGVVYAAETGFIISRNPDTVRAPDVAFISSSRAEQIEDDTGFVPMAPDLAIEVISPTDTFSSVEEKAFAWLSSGTQLVLLVDPASRQLHAYRSAQQIVVFDDHEELDAGDVVPGWRLQVGGLFG